MSLKRILVLVTLVFYFNGFGQELNCKKFKTGTFVIPADSFVPTTTIKRDGKTQIETLSDEITRVLNIEWIDECNYVLTIDQKANQTLTDLEKKIEDSGGLKIEMLRTANDTLFFRAKATLDGIEYPLDGIQIKTSNKF